MARNLTEEQVAEFWHAYRQGESASRLERRFGIGRISVHDRIRRAGGVSPMLPCRADRHLRLEEREEISRGLAAGESLRRIAQRLGRSPSTISREIAANGGRVDYRATRADRAAARRRRRPKVCKLAASPRLATLVDNKLKKKWSPEQIAGWLKRTHPDDPELHVSAETIYRTLFIQSRGALNRELTEHLRTRRTVRQPGHVKRASGTGKGQLVDIVSISERPAEAADPPRALKVTSSAW